MNEIDWCPLSEAHLRLPRVPGVYLIRSQDGREYVGISKNIRHRAMRHCHAKTKSSVLHRAIATHGLDSFQIAVWRLAPIADLPELEIQAIAERGSFTPDGYNLTRGGGVIHDAAHSEERRLKTLETNRRLHLGVKRSPETKAKMSAAMLGGKRPNARKGYLGPKMPQQTRDAIRRSRLQPIWVWVRDSLVPLEFDSIWDAVAHTGKSRSSVQQLLKEERLSNDGLAFAYALK